MNDNTNIKTKGISARLDWLDAIKAFAMLLVIFGHLGFNGIKPFMIYSCFIKLPLFFAASGFVFNPKKNISIPQFLKSRTERILVPYVLLSTILCCIDFIKNDYTILTCIKKLAVSLLMGNKMLVFTDFIPCKFAYVFSF